MKQTMRIAAVALLTLGGATAYAQQAQPMQHDHSQMDMSMPGMNMSGSGASSALNDDNAIFCPTMKTGQLCSHGTAQVLGLKGTDAEAWMEIARKYNKAVDAATVQLFKDADVKLTPKQSEMLKAWFAIGLNPQINELLYSKGLGEQKAEQKQ